MSEKPTVRDFFAGGNTAYGFYSLFDNIMVKNGKTFIILKGGPGTGKSTILNHIKNTALDMGYDIECFYCSSDSTSLDAIAIPSIGAGVADGTFPHAIDPIMPGVYDHIVNLGECWDEKILQSYKQEINEISQTIKYCFSSVYRYLAEARLALTHLKLHTVETVDFNKINFVTHNFLKRILGEEAYQGKGSERHLFASAITPEGFVNFYPSILAGCSDIYYITGDHGIGKSTLLEKVYKGFRFKGFDLEVYHCALNPEVIDGLIVPERKLAVVKTTDLYPFVSSEKNKPEFTETISLNYFTAGDCPLKADMYREYWDNISLILKKALQVMKDVKFNLIQREQYYHKAMDFDKVDIIKDKILDKIFKSVG